MSIGAPSPNPGWRLTTFLALLPNATKGTCIEGAEIARLQRALEKLLGVRGLIPVGKGRYGIELALRAAGTGQGDEVIVPTFCCKTILPPIAAVGAAPVFADVNDDLRLSAASVRRSLTSRTRAVLLPHLFGNPVAPAQLLDFCGPDGPLLIDDACQALGGTLDGAPLGTFGSVGVWSFGYGKITFGAAGGFLYIKEPHMRKRALEIQRRWPQPRQVIRRALAVPVTRQWGDWLHPIYRRLPGNLLTRDRNAEYRPELMANLDAAIALDLMRDLPRKLAARRSRAALYRKGLAPMDPPLQLIPQAKESVFTSLVLSCGRGDQGSRNADSLRSFLDVGGFRIDRSYSLLHRTGSGRGGSGERLPTAESLAGGLLELPVDPTVHPSQIVRLCDAILRWQRSCKGEA
jgi:dTDP-4-amino-4,6-dideoxygalactose transaminase